MSKREREKLQALVAAVRAVDVEIFGKQTAANVQSEDYAKLLYARGVRVRSLPKRLTGFTLHCHGATPSPL